ncbi:Cathepsin L-like proteinase [Echinococcus granulosus]|nr:Cathepsin L-like proteinase [Echinococcus granulosus]
MRIFINNYFFTRWHNERYYLGLETYSTALNAFADLTLKEFAEKYLTLKQTAMEGIWQDMSTQYVERPTRMLVPDSIDWRKKGLVTSIKDQVGSISPIHLYSLQLTMDICREIVVRVGPFLQLVPSRVS